mmetsp:Transcript_31686/g.49550  ORF Transcript_31686/g.49550 Transcript_31686/m.49550 type:complete len:84 (-) Transcript_31686:45-296(-)
MSATRLFYPPSVRLYKAMLRQIEKFEPNTASYYRYYVRQNFASHLEEDDLERINEIIARAEGDSLYIIAKYNENPPDSVYDWK